MSDDQLEQIRKKKLMAMQNRASDEDKQSQTDQFEAQKQALLRQILTEEARQRLNNLKMVKADFVDQIEIQLIQMAQSGKLPTPLSDSQLKQILVSLQSRKREPKITRI